MIVDFRSDTVTRPTAAMLECMFHAKVGDDVFGEDPTITELEKKTADFFGFESGIYCPSGTMTNQIAIKIHTSPGDEVICERNSHIYLYEGGGIAFNSGASVRLIDGDRGRINAEQVKQAINPDDVHKPISRLVSLENTCNRGGGACYDLAEIEAIKQVCSDNHLTLHLDGARIWNAIIAQKQDPKDYSRLFDSISVCFSKSLGAPVGSMLLGTKEMIKKARRFRKVFGGGMRQAGYLAAACIYAMDNHLQRLQEDHKHAKLLAEALLKHTFIDSIYPVETNIIIANLKKDLESRNFKDAMQKEGILLMDISPTQIRMVVHLDIHTEMIDYTIKAIQNYQ